MCVKIRLRAAELQSAICTPGNTAAEENCVGGSPNCRLRVRVKVDGRFQIEIETIIENELHNVLFLSWTNLDHGLSSEALGEKRGVAC